jgi:hypothetical protein
LVHPDNETYFQKIDLTVDFLEAMRRGLSRLFFMPGEAQGLNEQCKQKPIRN